MLSSSIKWYFLSYFAIYILYFPKNLLYLCFETKYFPICHLLAVLKTNPLQIPSTSLSLQNLSFIYWNIFWWKFILFATYRFYYNLYLRHPLCHSFTQTHALLVIISSIPWKYWWQSYAGIYIIPNMVVVGNDLGPQSLGGIRNGNELELEGVRWSKWSNVSVFRINIDKDESSLWDDGLLGAAKPAGRNRTWSGRNRT